MQNVLNRSLVFALVIAASIVGFAQTPKAPAFEVAAISPSPPLDIARIAASGDLSNLRIGMNVTDTRVDISQMTISNLLPTAFKVQPYQVSAPSWLNDTRFDIHATFPQGATREQVPEMLQALLVERFKMVSHREKREMAVYSLVVGKDGSKLTEAAPEPTAPPSEPGPDDIVVGQGDNQVRIARGSGANGATSATMSTGRMTMNMSMGSDGKMSMDISRMTMEELVQLLTQLGDRPVIDDTGLKGTYRVKLELAMNDLLNVARASGLLNGLGGVGGGGGLPGAPAGGAADPSGSSIFETVQRLGLKLEPKRAPIDFVVVDKIEKAPTEN